MEFAATGLDPWDEPEIIGLWLGDWDPEAFDRQAAKKRFDA